MRLERTFTVSPLVAQFQQVRREMWDKFVARQPWYWRWHFNSKCFVIALGVTLWQILLRFGGY